MGGRAGRPWLHAPCSMPRAPCSALRWWLVAGGCVTVTGSVCGCVWVGRTTDYFVAKEARIPPAPPGRRPRGREARRGPTQPKSAPRTPPAPECPRVPPGRCGTSGTTAHRRRAGAVVGRLHLLNVPHINNRPLKTSLSYAKLKLSRRVAWTTAAANFFLTSQISTRRGACID
jgi:hypothetical protein